MHAGRRVAACGRVWPHASACPLGRWHSRESVAKAVARSACTSGRRGGCLDLRLCASVQAQRRLSAMAGRCAVGRVWRCGPGPSGTGAWSSGGVSVCPALSRPAHAGEWPIAGNREMEKRRIAAPVPVLAGCRVHGQAQEQRPVVNGPSLIASDRAPRSWWPTARTAAWQAGSVSFHRRIVRREPAGRAPCGVDPGGNSWPAGAWPGGGPFDAAPILGPAGRYPESSRRRSRGRGDDMVWKEAGRSGMVVATVRLCGTGEPDRV